MSSLVVKVSTIDEIKPHPKADKLEIATIMGWQTVVPKDEFKVGDKCVFIPYDTCITAEIAKKLGVEKYLKKNNRIAAVNLRGHKSFGVVTKPFDPAWPVGKDVASEYGATKYVPPEAPSLFGNEKKLTTWQKILKKLGLLKTKKRDPRQHPLFPKYTDLENLRNYHNVIQPGEMCVASEKIHGTNVRIGSIEGNIMAGSRNFVREMPTFGRPMFKAILDKIFRMKPEPDVNFDECKRNWWWFPYTNSNVRTMLSELGKQHKQVVLYGETYGSVQYLHYGVVASKSNPVGLAFRAFDLLIDGKFLNYDDFLATCNRFGVDTVPIVAKFPFSIEKVRELSSGQTNIGGETHYREGVVVRPVEERIDPTFGRVVLKYINDDYLLAQKSQDNDTTDV